MSLPNTLIMSTALPFCCTRGGLIEETRACGWKASTLQVPSRNEATTAALGIRLAIVCFFGLWRQYAVRARWLECGDNL